MNSIWAKKRLSFVAIAALALAIPCQSSETASSPGNIPAFETVTIRQNLTTPPRWKMEFTADGVSAQDVTLRWAFQEAYGVYDQRLWTGGPDWFDDKRFDIEAKFDANAYPKLTIDQRMAMLQQLLADRFKLTVHRESKIFPTYSLTVAEGGSKLEASKPGDGRPSDVYGVMCMHSRDAKGDLELKACSLQQIAEALTGTARADLGRIVVDRTGLTGRYNVKLNWTPNGAAAPASRADASIFAALEEQLGLKLNPVEGPLDTLVINHAEMPSEN